MKKFNFVFIGECVIVVALLFLIGFLMKDDKNVIQRGENNIAVVEISEESVNEEENIHDEVNVTTFLEDTVENEMVAENIQADSVEGTDSINVNIKTVDEYDDTKIVVFGDSIWNAGRGENGISEQVMEVLDVKIYNCAIGGTSAALDGGDATLENWDSKSFNGMMYIANGLLNADDLIPDDKACEVIKSVDFEEIDYVIVSYGLNDYFSNIPVYPDEYYDMHSYVGALRHGIRKLQKQYPNMEVILTSPTYCEWFKGERQYELGAYTESARSVAEELDVHFLDMYHALGDTPDEKTQYLSDGVHLTDEGLTLYANWVIQNLRELGIKEK